MREHFGEQVYETVIPRTVRLSEAPSFGKCILEYDANGQRREILPRAGRGILAAARAPKLSGVV